MAMVFAVSDQEIGRIVELLIKKIIPFLGIPEVVLTDRCINFLQI